jgi:hypothetical protein
MGGAFALPAGLRGVMVDAYQKGEFKNFGDFFERASGIMLDTAKGYVTGAATAGVVGKVGQVTAGASAPIRSVSQMTAEIGTMVTVGSALEGHVPSWQDFQDGAILLLGAKGAVKGYNKLANVYKKTGVTPEQVITDAKTDPTIQQDLASGREIPRAYEDQIDPMFKTEPTQNPLDAVGTRTDANGTHYVVTTEGVGEQRYTASGTGIFGRLRSESGKDTHSVLNAEGDFVDASEINRSSSEQDPARRAFVGDKETNDLIARLAALATDLNVSDAVAAKASEAIKRLARGEATAEQVRNELGQPEPVTNGMATGTTATPGVTAPPPTTPQQVMTQRQALEKMAGNLGIQVQLTPGPRFHSSSTGYIAVPPEGPVNTVKGITDSEFIFAHELGHAIMITRRGAMFGRERKDGNFSFWSNAKLRREISNWDEFTDASKEMRPEFWNDPTLGQQKYVRTPDELVADTIASVLTGKRDISILYPMMEMVGIKPEGLGLASGGGGAGQPPGSFPTPAAGGPEPGSLGEAQQTILGKVNIGGDTPKQPMSFDKLYTAALDDLAPIKRAVSEMAQGKDVPANQDPYVMARLVRGVYGKAQQALEFGTFDFKKLENNGKSLKDIIEPVKDDLDGLRAYAISSRAMELKDRFIVSGFDIDAAAKVVNETKAKFEPIMREMVEYQNRITAYLRDSGVLSKDAYEAMLEANKNYVPFYRMLEGDTPANGAGGGLKVKNPIKQIKGSGMDIVDPIESIIKNTYTYLTLADRNATTKAFYDLGVKSGMADAFFEKVPTPLRATKVTDAEMAQFLKENGINKMPADALTVFRAAREPLAPDQIGFFQDGKWTVLKVDLSLIHI